MNKSVLIGHITRDLDVKYSANGMAVLKLNLAVNRRKKGEADFINCIAFDKTAETIQKYFKKGSQIAIWGHIQTGSYENKEGKKVYTTDVIIDEFDFCGSSKQSGENQNYAAAQDKAMGDLENTLGENGFYPMDEDDELPF